MLEWIEYLNKSHKTIKFTVEYSTSEMNFFDTKVTLIGTIRCIQIYTSNLQIQIVTSNMIQLTRQNAKRVSHTANF